MASEQTTPSPKRYQVIWERLRPRLPALGLFFGGILVALLAVAIYSQLNTPPDPLSEDEMTLLVADVMASATPPPNFASQVYQQIFPSLVFIQTERLQVNPEERFGLGSGVIFNDMGQILTSLHVVEGADSITLFYYDGSETVAEIVSADPANDIAVLQPQLSPEVLVPAILGNPSLLNIGDEAFAVGNPLGLANSMSEGVISGFDRVLSPEGSEVPLEGLIQFDAAVNRGSSGGPLLNRNGHVVGIVTALANPANEEFFIGIGFAVPINVAMAGADNQPSY